jgi:hypothetical protein
MSFKNNQDASSQFSCDGSKTHPSDNAATKHANKDFLSQLGGLFLQFSLGLKDGLGLDG